jgi:transketolase
VFSRQGLPFQPRTARQITDIARGGYVLADCDGDPEAIIIATGSEVALALEAADGLRADGRRIRVVSMPCTNLFDTQDAAYRDSVLPPGCRRRVAVEAGAPEFWRRYVGDHGAVLGLSRFGLSAPAAQVYEQLGITAAALKRLVEGLD